MTAWCIIGIVFILMIVWLAVSDIYNLYNLQEKDSKPLTEVEVIDVHTTTYQGKHYVLQKVRVSGEDRHETEYLLWNSKSGQ